MLLFSPTMESRQVLYGTDCLFEGVLLVVSKGELDRSSCGGPVASLTWTDMEC